jgi:uncharacterized Zn-binding protein involved in type VI secretion
MPGMARVGDMFSGICCCYPSPPPVCIAMVGTIVTGEPNHTADGLSVALLGSLVVGACGHTGIIITASSKTSSGGVANAFLGSSVSGCLIGTIITGSPNVSTGL